MTRLVTVAHGTRTGVGNGVADALTRLAASRLGVSGVTSYVELQEPLLADALAASAEPTVVVPLLLSRGYHTRVDLPGALESAAGVVRIAPALGPAMALAQAQVSRLLDAGARPGQPVVLAAAGSHDPESALDLREAADLLAEAWGSEVRLASMAAGDLADVIRPGDAVSLYLLAAGFFATTIAEAALAAGATVVSEVIGVHDAVVALLAARFDCEAPALVD